MNQCNINFSGIKKGAKISFHRHFNIIKIIGINSIPWPRTITTEKTIHPLRVAAAWTIDKGQFQLTHDFVHHFNEQIAFHLQKYEKILILLPTTQQNQFYSLQKRNEGSTASDVHQILVAAFLHLFKKTATM